MVLQFLITIESTTIGFWLYNTTTFAGFSCRASVLFPNSFDLCAKNPFSLHNSICSKKSVEEELCDLLEAQGWTENHGYSSQAPSSSRLLKAFGAALKIQYYHCCNLRRGGASRSFSSTNERPDMYETYLKFPTAHAHIRIGPNRKNLWFILEQYPRCLKQRSDCN